MYYKYPAGKNYYREDVNLHPVGRINVPKAKIKIKRNVYIRGILQAVDDINYPEGINNDSAGSINDPAVTPKPCPSIRSENAKYDSFWHASSNP